MTVQRASTPTPRAYASSVWRSSATPPPVAVEFTFSTRRPSRCARASSAVASKAVARSGPMSDSRRLGARGRTSISGSCRMRSSVRAPAAAVLGRKTLPTADPIAHDHVVHREGADSERERQARTDRRGRGRIGYEPARLRVGSAAHGPNGRPTSSRCTPGISPSTRPQVRPCLHPKKVRRTLRGTRSRRGVRRHELPAWGG